MQLMLARSMRSLETATVSSYIDFMRSHNLFACELFYFERGIAKMMFNRVVTCPICSKRIFLRIQDGGYLNEYPVRFNCINCRALIKGTYVMDSKTKKSGLYMENALAEECNPDSVTLTIPNVDYVAEVSGELPCNKVQEYKGGLPTSPFLHATDYIEDMQAYIERLKYFNNNMEEWKAQKSTAFQLLDDGSIDFISTALKNKMGEYSYECDHYLKSLHCLQEVVLEETKYIFFGQSQDEYVDGIRKLLTQIDKESLKLLIDGIGGVDELIHVYRKTIEVISEFMTIYPNLLPAETYCLFKKKEGANNCIATCSFNDIKTFYQDSYESLLSMLMIPVCLDNIIKRSDYQSFATTYDDVYCSSKYIRNLCWYRGLDNGTRINKLDESEEFQKLIALPANRLLRNGIGHNNIKYDSLSQTITAFDMKKKGKINYQDSLMNVAIDCLGLAKTAVILSEIILYLLRLEFRTEGIHSIIHPRFYKGAQPNDKCPCGSGVKYKKCCKSDVEKVMRS